MMLFKCKTCGHPTDITGNRLRFENIPDVKKPEDWDNATENNGDCCFIPVRNRMILGMIADRIDEVGRSSFCREFDGDYENLPDHVRYVCETIRMIK